MVDEVLTAGFPSLQMCSFHYTYGLARAINMCKKTTIMNLRLVLGLIKTYYTKSVVSTSKQLRTRVDLTYQTHTSQDREGVGWSVRRWVPTRLHPYQMIPEIKVADRLRRIQRRSVK